MAKEAPEAPSAPVTPFDAVIAAITAVEGPIDQGTYTVGDYRVVVSGNGEVLAINRR